MDGDTLADRITLGSVPLDEALPIAKQIAEALEAAHEQGVTHRDLKPANIKVGPDGLVKVLDFGLAKLASPAEAGSRQANTMSPTLSVQATMAGVYDKLLQVPVLNLSVRLIDRVARSKVLQTFDPAALGRSLTPRRRHLAYMSVWAIVFGLMSAAHGVGDHHPGQSLRFWQQACQEDRPYACGYLTSLQSTSCKGGSGWACNELGILYADVWRDRAQTVAAFRVGCDRGFAPACVNVTGKAHSDRPFASGPPTLADYPIILRDSKGPITDRRPSALYARACTLGWPETCDHR